MKLSQTSSFNDLNNRYSYSEYRMFGNFNYFSNSIRYKFRIEETCFKNEQIIVDLFTKDVEKFLTDIKYLGI
jgi:hypothetical protein